MAPPPEELAKLRRVTPPAETEEDRLSAALAGLTLSAPESAPSPRKVKVRNAAAADPGTRSPLPPEESLPPERRAHPAGASMQSAPPVPPSPEASAPRPLRRSAGRPPLPRARPRTTQERRLRRAEKSPRRRYPPSPERKAQGRGTAAQGRIIRYQRPVSPLLRAGHISFEKVKSCARHRTSFCMMDALGRVSPPVSGEMKSKSCFPAACTSENTPLRL